MKILVTGASGFLGKQLVKSFCDNNISVVASVRDKKVKTDYKCNVFDVGNMDSNTDWASALSGVNVVVHCAARAHVMNETSSEPLSLFRKVNVEATLNLANQAIKAGVKRFIFISSIKVNGESTSDRMPYNSFDAPAPEDDYGQSKFEAERSLKELAVNNGLELVIIRPPLVYGRGVKGNFASLLKLVTKNIPFPFGLITRNKRSLVYIGNLIDLIEICTEHPDAVNQTFLVSDDDDLSTASLIKAIASAMNKPIVLLPVPVWLYRLIGTLSGKSNVIERLVGSLEVDIAHTKKTLKWKPPFTVIEGMKITVQSSNV